MYESICSISCPSTYSLVGLPAIKCETDGSWTDGYGTMYCRRINDPPSTVSLFYYANSNFCANSNKYCAMGRGSGVSESHGDCGGVCNITQLSEQQKMLPEATLRVTNLNFTRHNLYYSLLTRNTFYWSAKNCKSDDNGRYYKILVSHFALGPHLGNIPAPPLGAVL